jgi:hypothetical protein
VADGYERRAGGGEGGQAVYSLTEGEGGGGGHGAEVADRGWGRAADRWFVERGCYYFQGRNHGPPFTVHRR